MHIEKPDIGNSIEEIIVMGIPFEFNEVNSIICYNCIYKTFTEMIGLFFHVCTNQIKDLH